MSTKLGPATFQYKDFDGTIKEGTADIFEEGEYFWAQNLGVFGCSKRCSNVVHWKPIKAAITNLLGGRELISYTYSQ